MSLMSAKKIRAGIWEYRGFRLCNCGYHEPDHCVIWEAVDIITGNAEVHSSTKAGLMIRVDKLIAERRNIHKKDGDVEK